MEIEKPGKVWTYDDLVAMGEYTDGRKYEIFDGELVVSPSPTVDHQRIVANLAALLRDALTKPRLAEVLFAPFDVVISPTRVVQPDLLVVAVGRRARVLQRHAAVEAPDLAIEILSPSNTKHDRVRKRRFYARIGIREYWIVDPESESIEVLALIDGGLSYRHAGFYASDERLRSTVFDLELDVAQVFADPLAE